jgi:DNA-3-methyladenine glycosylase II
MATAVRSRPSTVSAAARPPFWLQAKRRLSAADPVLGAIIRGYPRIALTPRGDAFYTLARAIVGQQISVKAADSVWMRLRGACGEVSPRSVMRRRATTLRACGLSGRKAEYLRDLAAYFADGRVDQERLLVMSDDEVIERLTDIRGIGRWTAEMFLIFNLQRPDVLPLDDLGLLKAVGRHYLSGRTPALLLKGEGRRKVIEVARRWIPYRSVATWYLWRSMEPVPVEY